MLYAKFIQWFIDWTDALSASLPVVDTAPVLHTLATLMRWFSSFDVIFPMGAVFFWAKVTLGVTAALGALQLALKTKGVFWGAGAS